MQWTRGYLKLTDRSKGQRISTPRADPWEYGVGEAWFRRLPQSCWTVRGAIAFPLRYVDVCTLASWVAALLQVSDWAPCMWHHPFFSRLGYTRMQNIAKMPAPQCGRFLKVCFKADPTVQTAKQRTSDCTRNAARSMPKIDGEMDYCIKTAPTVYTMIQRGSEHKLHTFELAYCTSLVQIFRAVENSHP